MGVRSLRSSKRQPIEKALGIRFGGEELYVWAFTHRSFAYENGGLPTNERLEFLGDAVLGLVVTDIIYRAFPDLPEGQLAKLRAATVNMNVLAEVARELGVGDAVRLGRGEELSGGRDKSSILADTLEAVLGAIYLDKGLSRAAALVRRLFEHRVMEAAGRGAALDYKTSLQELAASSLGGMPSYAIEEEGPDHAKRFTATVSVAGTAYGSGKGRSKKEAEQQAAREAFESLATDRMVTGTGDAGGGPRDPGAAADGRVVPELPELDVLAENLAARLAGARVAAVRVVSVAALKTFDPPIDSLVGLAVTGAGRRAKYVWLELGELRLVMHLSLGGRLVLGPKPAARKVAVLTVELDDGRVLSMTEGGTQRRAAVWLVDDVEKVPPLAGLGPEPLDPGFTTERLAAILAEGGHTLKGMLTDQRAMAGVGNAWSDDVLHRARMSPFARPERLDPSEVERLHAALVGVLTEARATLAEQVGDEVVIPKASERLFAVHGRAGAACYVCGDTIRSVWMGERETSYCPTCQTGGRVLADRRRSRFLR